MLNFILFEIILSFDSSLPEQTVPDLMFFESQRTDHHRDDAQMHHFLETNLYRAKPKVRKYSFKISYLINKQMSLATIKEKRKFSETMTNSIIYVQHEQHSLPLLSITLNAI